MQNKILQKISELLWGKQEIVSTCLYILKKCLIWQGQKLVSNFLYLEIKYPINENGWKSVNEISYNFVLVNFNRFEKS